MWENDMGIEPRFLVGPAMVTAFVLCGAVLSARAEAARDPLIGTWTIDRTKSAMNRDGPEHPGTLPPATFTWTFAPEGSGLRMRVYLVYPAATPVRTVLLTPDGKEHPCETKASCFSASPVGSDETIAYTRISPDFWARIVRKGGNPAEAVTYAVSSDGKTLAVTSWNPETPQYQNIQVFVRKD
jgi:hypothetical protein